MMRWGEKRYHSMDYDLKQAYGEKVYKITLDGGMTCPNRDGSKGTGGCTYCSEQGSGDFAGNPAESLVTQFEKVRDLQLQKWPDAYYIPYFQAFTNTNIYFQAPTLEYISTGAFPKACRKLFTDPYS